MLNFERYRVFLIQLKRQPISKVRQIL